MKQLGRIDCAVIPKMKAQYRNDYSSWMRKVESKEYPRGSIPLISLIEEADEETMIMYFTRVRDTLLVEGSLDEARRVHRDGDKRWRVVTLKGELIEKFGTMSGGKASNYLEDRKHRGSHTDESEIRNLQQRRQATESKLNSMQHSWTDKVRAADRAKEQVRRGEIAIENLKAKVIQLTNEIKQFEATLTALAQETQQASSKAQLSDLAKKSKLLDELKAKEEEANKKHEKEVAIAKEIESRMANIGGKPKLDLEEKKKTLTAAVKKAKDTVNNADCEAAEKTKKAEIIVNSKLPNTKEELARIQREIEDKESRITALEDRARPLLAEYENMENLLVELKKAAKKSRKAFQDQESAIRADANNLIPVQNQVADLETSLAKVKKVVNDERKAIEMLYDDFKELPEIDIALVESLQETVVNKKDEDGRDSLHIKPEIRVKQEITDLDERVQEECTDVTRPAEPKNNMSYIKGLESIKFPQSFDEVASIPLSEFQLEVHRCEETLSRYLRGGDTLQDLTVLNQFMEKARFTKAIQGEMREKTDRVNALIEHLETLATQRLTTFSRGFNEISIKLKELYQMLTLGGDAELEYRDPSDPFKEGVEFSVRPCGKSWRVIQNLSGGEKTLSSLALIFALHHYKPTPIYFLDEIDAALDPQNVVIIASYVAEEVRGLHTGYRHSFHSTELVALNSWLYPYVINSLSELIDWLASVKFKTVLRLV
eukprot:Blabericola_migrator_1__3325@NODE_197_length_11501_cov_283_066206_g170_i0_p3_GENE_NODE_197_length_11501_cov_283_066206_g170_i0NODE_197_length_11501_cov_283_066206_g170_i0_p3_ORF_typecomplete_len716_score201_18SMC_N/PF02463_19/8e02SMC_N/PF02463_19/1_4e43DUF3584/PF12128_8/8_1e07AAA_13/PF13166_6/17AAA_13/PF13166_6/35SbcCD_C/PF13558_6/2_2e03SbcCD_C/PF13558_6/0_0019FlaC_arch/PF05377_11/2_5e03FlaC_arch/PF05377_11/72FlaC_arch/PF05377_11/0_034FlaC_arch/PF05377_11/0_069FlaC_arch/PF05377_11/5_1e03FlaC_arc